MASTSVWLRGHPTGLGPLFMTELWERFSYYGMRALLMLFMVAPAADGGLGLAVPDAAMIYGNYTMSVYMLSIIGGLAADRMIGARRAVLVGGSIIAAGHFTLAVPSIAAFYLGLCLIIIGTGLFKPSISVLVGRLYAPGDTRRDAGFSIFYMGINIGALIAPLVTGFLAQSDIVRGSLALRGIDPGLSWHLGFGSAGIGMVLGLFALLRRLPDLDHTGDLAPDAGHAAFSRPVLRDLAAASLGTLLLAGLVFLSDRDGYEALRWAFVVLPIIAAVALSVEENPDLRKLSAIFVLFTAAMIFFALFEQAGVTIALFADKLTRTEIADLPFPSAWFQSLNSLFVIALVPVFAVIWSRLGESQPSAPVKFALGLFFLASAFLVMSAAAIFAEGGKVSPLWLVGFFFLQTVGELCLSPVGLSTMTKLAPARAVGLVLGIWFLASALGNKLASVLGSHFEASDPAGLADHFFWQAASVGAAALVMLALAPWVKRLMGEHGS